MDLQLVREVGKYATTQQAQWLGQIRAGAAITAYSQAKFDNTKSPDCLQCGVPDTKQHRLFHCSLYGTHDLVPTPLDTPAICELLLPVWPDDVNAHLQELTDLVDTSWQWQLPRGDIAHADVFTDGSCFYGDEDVLALGAWAVVWAQQGVIIASGLMRGLCQSIDRCELLAAVVAMRWACAAGCGLTMWTDSKYVFDGVRALLDGACFAVQAHPDLWQELTFLLESCVAVYVQLVPSHVDSTLCEEPVTEWAVSWNQVADRQAIFMNGMRTPNFWERHRGLLRERKRQRYRLKALADRYVQIAEHTQAAPSFRRHDDEEDEHGRVQLPESLFHDSFADLFPVGWQQLVTFGGGLPKVEALHIVQWLVSGDESELPKFRVTWVELVFLLVRVGCVVHQQRTLAHWVTSLRRLMKPLLVGFGARDWLVWSGLDGVSFALEAIIVGVSHEDLVGARTQF